MTDSLSHLLSLHLYLSCVLSIFTLGLAFKLDRFLLPKVHVNPVYMRKNLNEITVNLLSLESKIHADLFLIALATLI